MPLVPQQTEVPFISSILTEIMEEFHMMYIIHEVLSKFSLINIHHVSTQREINPR